MYSNPHSCSRSRSFKVLSVEDGGMKEDYTEILANDADSTETARIKIAVGLQVRNTPKEPPF